MSRQPLLLYSLIVERSVSHPVRLTAGVPLVTPQCPLPADAIVAAMAAEERRAGPCRMWDNTGKEEEGIPELCVQKPGQPSVSESTPLWLLPPSSPEDRLCHPLTFCMWRGWEWRWLFVSLLHRFFFFYSSFQRWYLHLVGLSRIHSRTLFPHPCEAL